MSHEPPSGTPTPRRADCAQISGGAVGGLARTDPLRPRRVRPDVITALCSRVHRRAALWHVPTALPGRNAQEHAGHFERKVQAQRWLDEAEAATVTGDHVDPAAGNTTFEA